MTVEQNNDVNYVDLENEIVMNPLERSSYKFFAQGLDEDFNDMKNMHFNKLEMEKNPVGTPEHHIAAAKMFGHIINHSKDMVKYHGEKGELDKQAKHQEVIHNANAEISHHLSQYHFAMANRHAEKGNIAAAISHQVKGEKEQQRHVAMVSWLKNRPDAVQGPASLPSDAGSAPEGGA